MHSTTCACTLSIGGAAKRSKYISATSIMHGLSTSARIVPELSLIERAE